MKTYLTANEVESMFGITHEQIDSLVADRKLNAYRDAGEVYYKGNDVIDVLSRETYLDAENKARSLLQDAHLILRQTNQQDKFFQIATHVGKEQWGEFFGQFGSDTGMSLEIKKSEHPNEVILSVVIFRHRQTWLTRILDAIKEIWAVFLGKETRYSIHLADRELSKFKDLLRNLQ